jgi:hypothetical protein
MGTYAVNIYGWIMCKFTVPQRTIESKTNMQYIFKIICIFQSLYTGYILSFTVTIFMYQAQLINTEILSDKITWNNKYNWTHIYVFSDRRNYLGTLSCAMCFIIALTLYNRTNHINVKYHKSPVWNCHREDKHIQYLCTKLNWLILKY